MKERARTTPRRWRDESFWDVRMLLSIMATPTGPLRTLSSTL
jgi:hypothetical protein